MTYNPKLIECTFAAYSAVVDSAIYQQRRDFFGAFLPQLARLCGALVSNGRDPRGCYNLIERCFSLNAPELKNVAGYTIMLLAENLSQTSALYLHELYLCVFIVGAKRTPFGTFGGVFRNTSASELQAIAANAAIKEAGISPTEIDSVVVGQVMPASSTDGTYCPRHAALKVGIPQEKPALGVNRLCGSGFQSIVNSAQEIALGSAKISLAGGVENMSQMPFVVRNIRFGTALGTSYQVEDMLWTGLTDTYCGLPMGMTAEKLGAKYGVTKDEVDKFALRSQQRWKAAQDAGVFKSEIEPVTITVKRKEVKVDTDEHPRPQTTLEGLQKLAPVFQKNGLVTAGTASGINDGAGALVLASEEAAKNLKPLARLVGWAYVGVDPSIMGIGPVPAIENLLKVTNMTLNDIDLVEINEAFCAQTLACVKALNLDMEKLNVNGGAIAMGHPVGASGARITAHLAHELRRRGLKRAIGSACIGGGQGIAVMLEAV